MSWGLAHCAAEISVRGTSLPSSFIHHTHSVRTLLFRFHALDKDLSAIFHAAYMADASCWEGNWILACQVQSLHHSYEDSYVKLRSLTCVPYPVTFCFLDKRHVPPRYVGHTCLFSGTRAERRRAKDYMKQLCPDSEPETKPKTLHPWFMKTGGERQSQQVHFLHMAGYGALLDL